MFPKTLALSLVLGTGLSLAQDSELRGPVVGYLTSANASVRPVLGIPGASLIGDPIGLPVALSVAAISPRQDYIIGAAAEDRRTVLLRLTGPDRAPQSIENARVGITRIIASPESSTLALYFKDTAIVQVLTGLPDQAKVIYEFEVPDAVGLIAVSADGSRVLYSVSANEQDAVFLRENGGDTVRVAAVRKAAALAFDHAGSSFAIADSQANEILVSRGGSLERLAGEREGILAPSAIAFSSRGVLAGSAGNKSVALIPADGTPIQFTSCGCTPESLDAIGSGIYQLTAAAKGTVYVYDESKPEPAIWFIPALLEASAGDAR